MHAETGKDTTESAPEPSRDRTRGAPGPRSFRSHLPALVALAAAAIVGVVVLGAERDRAEQRAEAQLGGITAQAAGAIAGSVRDQLARVEDATDARVVPAASFDATALAAAVRDSGVAAIDDAATPPSIIAPVYRGNPTSTAARRQQLTGYRIVPLQLNDLVARVAPPEGGLFVSGPSGIVLAGERPSSSQAQTFGAPVNASNPSGLRLQAWRPNPGVPIGGWLWVLGLLGLGGAAAGWLEHLQRQRGRAWREVEQARRHSRVVTQMAPVMQASLDLATVTPEATEKLTQAVPLAGLSLSLHGEGGEQQVYVWGTTPDAEVPAIKRPPARLKSGGTLALALTRGGRGLGTLRLTSAAALDEADMQIVELIAELMSSAVANIDSYAEQQRLVRQLRELDHLKTVFIGTASHELRTPVAVITGFSELLVQRAAAATLEDVSDFAETILTNARALDTLTEELLDLSNLELGAATGPYPVLDVGATVRAVMDSHPHLISDHELRLELPDAPAPVKASAQAIERILINLVGNAAKYSPPATAITVTVFADDDRVHLLVDDEGPGVAPELRDKVFTRFFRGNDDAVTRTRGAGVGLAIVAEFASAMSATVAVQQAPGGGARFRVSFPVVSRPDSSGPASASAGVIPAQTGGTTEEETHVPTT